MRVRFGLFIILLFSSLAYATPEIDAHPIPEEKNQSPWQFDGYIDASYNYLLRSNHFTSGVYNRLNDLAENGFTLQQLLFNIGYAPEKGFGWLITPILGRDANYIAPSGLNPNYFGSKTIALTTAQAYVQYQTLPFIFKIGELQSLSGIESYDYSQVTNFSRSILNGYAEPGIHMGVRVINQVSDYFTMIFGLNNGWNTVQKANHLDTMELGFAYKIPDFINIVIDGYSGSQNLTDNAEAGKSGTRSLLDIYGVWHANKKLTFAANFDYGIQTKAGLPYNKIAGAVWQGITLYANYIFKEKWRIYTRAEYFDDSEGYRTGVRQNWRELTLSLGYAFTNDLLLLAETRHDISNKNAFVQKTGQGAYTSNNQQSYALMLLYQFDFLR